MRSNFYQQLLVYNCYLLSLSLGGCTSVKFTTTMPGQPKAEYYSISKVSEQNNDYRVDTSVIYIYSNDLVRTYKTGQVEKVYTYMYLVFKNNGVTLFSNDSREHFDQENIKNIGGQYCFYKVEGDLLQLEIFDHNLKKFTIMYARIWPDKIHFYKDKLRVIGGGESKLDMTFKKSGIRYNDPLNWPQ